MTEAISLRDVELAAEDYRRDYDALAAALSDLREAQRALAMERLPLIRRRIHLAAESREALTHTLSQSKAAGLFDKPKTRVLHGLKLGFQKARDKLRVDDPAGVIARIRQLFPSEVKNLIRVEEKLNSDALTRLTDQARVLIGVQILSGEDQLIIRPVDEGLERLIATVLDDLKPELEAV